MRLESLLNSGVTNNEAVVHVLQKGSIRDTYLQAVARSVWLLAVSHDTQLEYVHISGTSNAKADALSRMFQACTVGLGSNQWLNCKWWLVHGLMTQSSMHSCHLLSGTN